MGSLFVVAGVLALAGFQCPPPAPPPASGPQCKASSDGNNTVYTVASGTDTLVTTAPPKTGTPASTVITVRGQTYLTIQVTVDKKTQQRTATVQFGPAFSGMREMVVTSTDGETFTGTLDGKQLKPFTRSSPPETFFDGSPLPAVTVDQAAADEFKAFSNKAKDAADSCKPTAALPGPLIADAINGHTYQRGSEASCVACGSACTGTAAGCEVAFLAGCSATGNYISATVCIVLGTIACVVTDVLCTAACESAIPGPCCPVACGVACCGTSDVCLNGMQGLCCPSDHPQPSGGRACCLATDVRNDAFGTCCPQNTTPCGTSCCAAGTVCDANTGQCCPLGQSCTPCGTLGQACCPGHVCTAGTGCSLGNNTCVDCSSNTRSVTIVNYTQHVGSNCFGNDGWWTCQGGSCTPGINAPATCNGGFRQGTCTARPRVNNGSACTASWQDATNCSCVVRIQTPSDCSKFVDCDVVATETQIPYGCPLPSP